MSILPTWPIAAGALAIGLAVGAYADHKVMQGRLDKIQIAHLAELSARDAKRIQDEVAARNKEQQLSARAGEIEQEKQNAIAAVRTDADALIARLRKQASAKPASASPVSSSAPACESTAGAGVPERTGVDLISLAQRADEMREALGACYKAYDLTRESGAASVNHPVRRETP